MSAYIPPTLVVDAVIFRIIEGQLQVLLIRRANEPFRGMWALPGGYNPRGETTKEALDRILRKKTGISSDDLAQVDQLYAFDTVARDPRGHAVSITYIGLGNEVRSRQHPSTQEPQFFAVDALPPLAYDHQEIINFARKQLTIRLSNSTVAMALLPQSFSLRQLQSVYEAVLGAELDKRNFRRKFLAFDVLQPLDQYTAGAHRPAQLYTFTSQDIQPLMRGFGQ